MVIGRLAGGWTLDDTLSLLGEGRPDWSLTPQQQVGRRAPLEPGLILAGAGLGQDRGDGGSRRASGGDVARCGRMRCSD